MAVILIFFYNEDIFFYYKLISFFEYTFGPFFKGIKRTPIKILGMIFLLSVLFFVMFSLLMFQSFTKNSIKTAQKKINIVFFLEKNVPEHKIKLLKANLTSLQKKGDIEKFRYISAEEGLQIFAKKYPEKFSYWKRNSTNINPISPSFEIIPKNKSVEELTRIFLGDDYIGIVDISKINLVKDTLLRSNKVIEFLLFLQKGIWMLVMVILLSIAGVTAAFISSSFFLRQKEIFIMRLVGASHSFIRTPFLIEGTLLVLFSVSFGWGIFFFFRKISLQKLLEIFSSPASAQHTINKINEMWNEFLHSLPLVIAVIFILAFLTSLFSIERLLRDRNILH